MKKKSLLLSTILLFGFAIPQIAVAADDNKGEQVVSVTLGEVALLAIPPVTVGLSLSGATVAGAPAAVTLSDENSRLRITSVVGSGVTRNVLAQITSAAGVPVGTLLQIEALPAIQNFIGTAGQSTGVQTLSKASSVEVLNTIGTCNSGILDGDGYVLKYTFGLDEDPATTAAAGSVDMTITYTLSVAS